MRQSKLFGRVAAWGRFPWLLHGFSTRYGGVSTVYREHDVPQRDGDVEIGGDLNLGWTKDDDVANVTENRRLLVEAVAGSIVPLVTVRQIHSARTLVVPLGEPISTFASDEGRATQEADGLMTDASGLLLGIQTADCVPVLVADTRQRVVSAFHAGWRGTAAQIVQRGVAQMRDQYSSAPEDLIAAIGPSIGACCYSVGNTVYEEFMSTFSYGETLFSRKPNEHPGSASSDLLYLDLSEANHRHLLDSGISADRIQIVGECTGCAGLPGRRRYFSHRRENGFTGRMLSVIGIAEHPSQ